MKRCLLIGLILIVIACATGAGYFMGSRRGFERGLMLQKGVFVGTLEALQKLRTGDIEAGTRRIESLCFMSANTMYGRAPDAQFVAKTFISELKQYRQQYRTNSAEWTVAEQN